MRLSITHRRSGKPAYDDQQLIESLKRQEPGAFDEFMSRYKHRLYGFIYHHVRNEDLAYDLLQDTCVRVYKHIGNYDESKPFTTWLFSIAINLCRSHARKARLRSSYSLDTVVNAETGATYHDTLADKNPGTEDISTEIGTFSVEKESKFKDDDTKDLSLPLDQDFLRLKPR